MRRWDFTHTFTLALAILTPAMHLPAQETNAPTEPPPLPKGIEVLARGPVHEAFAAPGSEATPSRAVPKRPPKPLPEQPPADKPEGHVVWIGGYWAWDDERNDFLWVSGLWRTPPPHKQWIPGYWREQGEQWQWIAGFWTDAVQEEKATKEVTYLPKPPVMPNVAPVGTAPNADAFYVPGTWTWNAAGNSYAWRAGYWARVQPGYVWVADSYLWTPNGYVFVPGYWDLALSQRGIVYAPVIVDPAVVTVGFAYTPVYAVSDFVIFDSLFIRPACCHYYFGDYYGPAYARLGYESIFVYGGRRYDSIVAYETWAHRGQPNWVAAQINVFNLRNRGVLPVPPRTLVQQNTIIQRNVTNITNVTNNITNINNTTNKYNAPVLTPASKLMAAKGIKTASLNGAAREQIQQHAVAMQQTATQRLAAERPSSANAVGQARTASLPVPKTQAVPSGSGFAALRSGQSASHPAVQGMHPGQAPHGMPNVPPHHPASLPPARRPPPRNMQGHRG